MKQRRRKTMKSLILALAVAAIIPTVAQARIDSERSQIGRPASSFYSSQAYRALMLRSEAMNTWYRNHNSTTVPSVGLTESQAARVSDAVFGVEQRDATNPNNTAYAPWQQAQPSSTVRHGDDRAGIHGPGEPQTPQVVSASGSGFDWSDASIGAATALGAAIVLASGVALSPRQRTGVLTA